MNMENDIRSCSTSSLVVDLQCLSKNISYFKSKEARSFILDEAAKRLQEYRNKELNNL